MSKQRQPMRRRELKEIILATLEEEAWPVIAERLSRYRGKDILNHLFTALCRNDRSKWHAVSGFGIVVPKMAAEDPESARIVMRRFLWNLNDESGGIGWGIPEAMGEVMTRDDMLFEEYSHMLISYMRHDGPEIFQDGNFIELPALQQGVLWGVARLLQTRRSVMREKEVVADLRYYLSSSDYIVRALAAFCLGMCGDDSTIDDLRGLAGDGAEFTLYWDHAFAEVSVAFLAEQAIERLRCESA